MPQISDDMAAILAAWGTPFQAIVRRSVTYGNTGDPTVTWNNTTTPTVKYYIEPYHRGARTERVEEGILVSTDFIFYVPENTDVQEADRLRPNGWVNGQDEYEVIHVQDYAPSHMEIYTQKVVGHGS